MSYDDDDDGEAARSERAKARASWPIKKLRLEDQPDVEIVPGTPEERFAMVYQITRTAWALGGKDMPDYERADMPGRVIRSKAAP